METTKKLSITHPPEIFKSIRIRKIFYEQNSSREVTGYINYIRTYYDGYNINDGDVLDDCILEKSKALFINAVFYISDLILFEGQKEDYMQRTRGNIAQNLLLMVKPLVEYSEVMALTGKKFTQYSIPLTLKLQTTWSVLPEPKEDSFVEFLEISVDYKKIKNLISTIKAI